MAFILEDGTGKADSNSYSSFAAFEVYHNDRGNAYSATQSQIEMALIAATDYIDGTFGSCFKGCREFPETPQALYFPRTDICVDGEELPNIPISLANATNEYALRALTSALAPDPTTDDSGQVVTGSKKKVGPISKELTFSDSVYIRVRKPYPTADRLIRSLCWDTSGVIRA